MSDPSKDAIFLMLGIEPGDEFNQHLRAWTPLKPQPSEDRICLLIPARGHTAAKAYEKLETGEIKITEYDAGKKFTAVEIRVRSAWDLFRTLKATAESEVESFAVRGAISDAGRSALDKGLIFRRSSEAQYEATRHLADRPSRVFIVDVDDWALPPGVAPTDLEGQAASAIAELAAIEPSLANAALIVQASNSAGQSVETFSLKIWAWLHEPTTTADFRDWTKAMNAALGPKALDPKQARAVQPIYHHKPRFSGMRDPMLGGRWLYQHRGGGEVPLTLSRGARLVSSPPPGGAGRLHVATGKDDDPCWKARLRANLGVSGCYGAVHAAVYAAVAFGASDEEIISEIRAAASDGRKFHNARWRPAYVREKTSPSFVASMIRDARAREARRSKRIASAFAALRDRLGLGAAVSADPYTNSTASPSTDQLSPRP